MSGSYVSVALLVGAVECVVAVVVRAVVWLYRSVGACRVFVQVLDFLGACDELRCDVLWCDGSVEGFPGGRCDPCLALRF